MSSSVTDMKLQDGEEFELVDEPGLDESKTTANDEAANEPNANPPVKVSPPVTNVASESTDLEMVLAELHKIHQLNFQMARQMESMGKSMKRLEEDAARRRDFFEKMKKRKKWHLLLVLVVLFCIFLGRSGRNTFYGGGVGKMVNNLRGGTHFHQPHINQTFIGCSPQEHHGITGIDTSMGRYKSEVIVGVEDDIEQVAIGILGEDATPLLEHLRNESVHDDPKHKCCPPLEKVGNKVIWWMENKCNGHRKEMCCTHIQHVWPHVKIIRDRVHHYCATHQKCPHARACCHKHKMMFDRIRELKHHICSGQRPRSRNEAILGVEKDIERVLGGIMGPESVPVIDYLRRDGSGDPHKHKCCPPLEIAGGKVIWWMENKCNGRHKEMCCTHIQHVWPHVKIIKKRVKHYCQTHQQCPHARKCCMKHKEMFRRIKELKHRICDDERPPLPVVDDLVFELVEVAARNSINASEEEVLRVNEQVFNNSSPLGDDKKCCPPLEIGGKHFLWWMKTQCNGDRAQMCCAAANLVWPTVAKLRSRVEGYCHSHGDDPHSRKCCARHRAMFEAMDHEKDKICNTHHQKIHLVDEPEPVEPQIIMCGTPPIPEEQLVMEEPEPPLQASSEEIRAAPLMPEPDNHDEDDDMEVLRRIPEILSKKVAEKFEQFAHDFDMNMHDFAEESAQFVRAFEHTFANEEEDQDEAYVHEEL